VAIIAAPRDSRRTDPLDEVSPVSSKRNWGFVFTGALAFALSAAGTAQTAREQEIIDRIKPVGEVCVQGKNECAAPAPAVAAGPRSGEQVYAAACVACHDAGVAGAPKIGVAADWTARIAQGEETLVANAINGIRGMPPRGTCMNCSDEEIKLAVQHMAAKSQ
jgi:cytochrome c5